MGGTVGLHLYSIHHDDHGLAAVERVAQAVPGLGRRLVNDHAGIRGAVVLSTCNRVEIYLDTDGDHDVATVAGQVRAALADGLPEGASPSWHRLPLRARHASEVLWHLFGVGAGLDSMVVGEREIAGQLRRALRAAHADGTATYLLTESIEQALRTSRRVAHLTNLAATGRSVVSVGLDLLGRDWGHARVLLLGTGAYAGAVVADLRTRGCGSITVHSESGRAAAFASGHGVEVAGSLGAELVDADVVVTCRGMGSPILFEGQVALAVEARQGRPLDIVDLALARDVEPGVGRLEGVRLLDLPTIQRHVPDASAREVSRAQDLVASGVHDLLTTLKGRQMDPAVVALRDTVASMVEDEVNRLPQGRPVTGEEAAHALRRLAARLIHVPSVRARKAAEEGRHEVYLAALAELYGIEAELSPMGEVPALNRNLEWGTPSRTSAGAGGDPAEGSLASAALDLGAVAAWCPGEFEDSEALSTVGPEERAGSARRVLDLEGLEPDTLADDACPVTGLSLTDLGEPRRKEAM